jgi:hypothetical protein
MQIPTFKSSENFLGDTDLPCLFGRIANSKLPGVSTRYIAENKGNPVCEIYLRGKNPKKISPWQQEILEQLFEQEGLGPAVAEAMKEYETNPDWGCNGYRESMAEDRQRIKKHGIVPYVVITLIVLDEVEQEALLCASVDLDGNLEEHGVTIYLKKGRWRFDHAEYYTRYQSRFDNLRSAKEQGAAAVARSKWLREWEAVFPPPPGSPAETDTRILEGEWHSDNKETAKALKRLGKTAEYVEALLRSSANEKYVFTGSTMSYSLELMPGIETKREWKVLKCTREGNLVTVEAFTEADAHYHAGRTDFIFLCDGRILAAIQQNGVYRKVVKQRS